MQGLVLGLPTTQYVPPAPVATWTTLRHVWETWEGRVWDLCSGAQGAALAPGMTGISMPTFEPHATVSPMVAGSRYRGYHTKERIVHWPIQLKTGAGTDAYLALESDWWKGIRPDKTGRWYVQKPGDTIGRWLELRFRDETDEGVDLPPELIGLGVYGINMVATRPYWHGPAVSRRWQTAPEEPKTFFGNGDGGPPFYLMPGNTMGNARITNSGDVDAWPVWKIEGPAESAQVGVGDRVVEIPITLAEGEHVTIDSDPTVQTAIDHTGADRTDELGEVEFASIPSGQNEILNVSMVGLGRITATLTPRYFRAI